MAAATIQIRRANVKKGDAKHAKAPAAPQFVYCNLLSQISDDGQNAYYQALSNGCITVNLFNPDGSFAASTPQDVVKGQILEVEDPHSFSCGC